MDDYDTSRSITLCVRLPPRLAIGVQRMAQRESNSFSAVVRRLIAIGLAREHAVEHDDTEPSCR